METDMFQSVEDYLEDMSPAPSPTASPSKKANKPKKSNSGSNDYRTNSGPAEFQPRRLAAASITTTFVKTMNELCTKCPYVPSPPSASASVPSADPSSELPSPSSPSCMAENGREFEQFISPDWDVAGLPQAPHYWKAKLRLWRRYKDVDYAGDDVRDGGENNDDDENDNRDGKGVGEDGLLEQEFGDDTPYPSKKLAKEAVAKVAVEWLKKEIDIRRAKLGKTGPRGPPAARRKGSAGSAKGNEGKQNGAYGDIISEGDGINWVGILNDYTMQKRIALPEYIPYETFGRSFSFKVRLVPFTIYDSLIPTSLHELENLEFGDTSIRYANKKLAKMGAAKQAVEWLRKRDPAMPDARQSPDPPASPNAINGSKKERAQDSGDDPMVIKVSKDMGPRKMLTYISSKLGLTALRYKLDGKNALYNAEILFDRPYEDNDVVIGPVKSVYGKEKAKMAVAKLAIVFCKEEAKKLGYTIVEVAGVEAVGANNDSNDDKNADRGGGDSNHNNTAGAGGGGRTDAPHAAASASAPASAPAAATVDDQDSDTENEIWEDAPDEFGIRALTFVKVKPGAGVASVAATTMVTVRAN